MGSCQRSQSPGLQQRGDIFFPRIFNLRLISGHGSEDNSVIEASVALRGQLLFTLNPSLNMYFLNLRDKWGLEEPIASFT